MTSGTESAGGGEAGGRRRHSLAGMVDAAEAIVVALIIALSFRAFLLEAYVIPTGSMAPTLLGAHFDVVCPKCGYAFQRGASVDSQIRLVEGEQVIPGRVDPYAELLSNKGVPCDALDNSAPVYCANCLNPIEPKEMPQYLGETEVLDGRVRGGLRHSVPLVWADNGDRIVVLKHLYTVVDPGRWDVVVFKDPEDPASNFIKRCAGLPGETLEIIDGDLFVNGAGSSDQDTRLIVRKPEHLQRHLWQVVYDNDFHPTDEGEPRPRYVGPRADGTTWAWRNPWVPTGEAGEWNQGRRELGDGVRAGGPVMTYGGSGRSGLRFMPRRNGAAPYTLNVLGYNNDFYVNRLDRGPRYPVGDLRVEGVWTPGAAGPLEVRVGRPDNCFKVRWAGEALELSRFNMDTGAFEPVTGAAAGKVGRAKAGRAYAVAMENVDHAVRFFIDGVRVLEFEEAWSAADARGRLMAARRARRAGEPDADVRIEVEGACTLGHLKLYRDLYYTQSDTDRSADSANEGRPFTLGADEFFALGDNSRHSRDSRMWTGVYSPLDEVGARRGVVPRRYLLGRAFFVYWPAGFRAEGVPGLRDVGAVANFGEMRVVR